MSIIYVLVLLLNSGLAEGIQSKIHHRKCFRPHDCGHIKLLRPESKSGVYSIYPYHNQEGVDASVYCDMSLSCGGWTVIQRRKDGSVNFKRRWSDYRYGFGKAEGEYWLGNDIIHTLTKEGNYELLVLMEDFEQTTRYALYKSFSIADLNNKYQLNISNYTGNAGDSLKLHNGRKFSTFDQDNDNDRANCAASYGGGWWYAACHNSNLNGHYLRGSTSSYAKGITWFHWRGYYYSMKETKMMIRRKM